jgi:hypothetical protein
MPVVALWDGRVARVDSRGVGQPVIIVVLERVVAFTAKAR